MKPIILGALKGLVAGAVIGLVFGLLDAKHHLFWTKILLGGTVGAAVGLVAGRPIWRSTSAGHAMFKCVVGAILGLLLMAIVYWIEPTGAFETRFTSGYLPFSALLGAAWGTFVEWDDSRR